MSRALRDAHDEGLHRRGLWEARAVHGAARAGSGLRGGWRVPGGKRGEAQRVQGAHHRHSGSHERRRGHQEGARRCDGVLVVLVPRGVHGYSTGTAEAVLDHAPPGARLVFSSGWHITRDGQDVYSWKLKAIVKVFGPLARLARFADLDDQVEACRRVFASDTRWTVVRGSDLEEGESQGLPLWSRHVGGPILESNITRRVDFALFMVETLENDELVHEAPAIVGRQTPSALAHAAND